jgi:nucleoside-diphosphate-sugar epimerase
MTIVVTGAAGFIGRALVAALQERSPGAEILAVDQSPIERTGARMAIGNIAYPQFARALIDRGVDTVFHLASLVSGGAEQNFELGSKVNLDATRDLLEACRLAGHRPRFVFSSSIAVYGGALPDPVTDETPATPRISYGVQKLVCELLINDYTRRGYVDGRSLRLPTVMVRPGSANTAVSGWASAIVREPLAGRDYTCPVRPDTRMACLSLGRTVKALLHAAQLDGDQLGWDRTVLLTGIPGRGGRDVPHTAAACRRTRARKGALRARSGGTGDHRHGAARDALGARRPPGIRAQRDLRRSRG